MAQELSLLRHGEAESGDAHSTPFIGRSKPFVAPLIGRRDSDGIV